MTFAVMLLVAIGSLNAADTTRETLPRLKDGRAPENFAEMWTAFTGIRWAAS